MKKINYILLTTILLVSCFPDTDEPYYNFTNNDFEYIPTDYENIGKIIKFRNENGDEASLEILGYATNKLSNGYSPYYYFDYLNIRFKFSNDSFDNKRIVLEIKKDNESRLTTTVYAGGHTTISHYQDLQTLEINNVIYDKVRIIPINSNFFKNFEIERMVYDFKKGIIGFNVGYNVVNDDVYHYRIISD